MNPQQLQSIKQRFGIIGNSPALNHALKTAIQVAPTELTVLITGESGVGKESFSKIIHSLSVRKHQKFIAVNCGAIPEGTINSELFGHTKGSFTGAVNDRKGYFESVDGGTIFLDEIGDMPLDTQAFLLRVLEQGEFVKVGSSVVENVDVRVIAATNVDLHDKIRQKKFREDLYYRLNTVPIHVPALRERKEDIHLLFRKFAQDFAERYHTQAVRLDESAVVLLENYNWTGNIRELKNVAEQASVLSEEKLMSAEDLLRFIPHALQRNLPMVVNGDLPQMQNTGNNSGYYEREILFKFLYDMKKDLNDLKSLVSELARTNNLRMPTGFPPLSGGGVPPMPFEQDGIIPSTENHSPSNTSPIILNTNFNNNTVSANNEKFGEAEEVEETLSIENMEVDLIKKALRKHRGRRKDAAEELGISERTLYRKIKQYGLDNE